MRQLDWKRGLGDDGNGCRCVVQPDGRAAFGAGAGIGDADWVVEGVQ